LLLRILDIVAQSGTDFAFPSQTLYMARDRGMDESRTAATSTTVNEWKDANDMQIPAFTAEQKEKLKGSIKYPPEGSAMNGTKDSTV
jgi:MscS family membrane protein